MNVEKYLNRIGFKGSASPTINVLRQLHRQHMLTVPFENLDIHQGKPIILDPRRFYRKIVEERRGGFCYELNGCFSWLLRKLGFKVSILSARVAQKNGGFTPEFDHMVLLVRLKGNLLVDVGFGDSFTEPKPFDSEDPTMDHGHFYRIRGKNRVRILYRRAKQNS
ncbi:MAG TPA: arylamine N-acetyltransferase, partial [Candidatus Bathyarchaeia archaeon]|nr:arylamine N-acetyltransferase [Candidatus Bathyarchaeia archaeon]